MEEEQRKFVECLARIELIKKANEDSINYWGNDISVNILFAELGRSIIKDFDNFSHEELNYIFGVIEKGMNSSNAILCTAVATGLLEAMSGQSSKDKNLDDRLTLQLGDASKKYLIEWRSWHKSR